MYLKNRIIFFLFLYFVLSYFCPSIFFISVYFVDFVLLSLVSFSFRFVSFSLISFRFVSFLFRFSLYRYPKKISLRNKNQIIYFFSNFTWFSFFESGYINLSGQFSVSIKFGDRYIFFLRKLLQIICERLFIVDNYSDTKQMVLGYAYGWGFDSNHAAKKGGGGNWY